MRLHLNELERGLKVVGRGVVAGLSLVRLLCEDGFGLTIGCKELVDLMLILLMKVLY